MLELFSSGCCWLSQHAQRLQAHHVSPVQTSSGKLGRSCEACACLVNYLVVTPTNCVYAMRSFDLTQQPATGYYLEPLLIDIPQISQRSEDPQHGRKQLCAAAEGPGYEEQQ